MSSMQVFCIFCLSLLGPFLYRDIQSFRSYVNLLSWSIKSVTVMFDLLKLQNRTNTCKNYYSELKWIIQSSTDQICIWQLAVQNWIFWLDWFVGCQSKIVKKVLWESKEMEIWRRNDTMKNDQSNTWRMNQHKFSMVTAKGHESWLKDD